jgi:thioredoxin 1
VAVVLQLPPRRDGSDRPDAFDKETCMPGDKIKEFTDDNFEQEVLQSEQPVLVDFWAEWCAPCRMLAPTIDQLASEFDGRVKVGKLDTDSNQQTSIKYGIQAIPTVLVFKDGEVVKKIQGVRNKKEYVEELESVAG